MRIPAGDWIVVVDRGTGKAISAWRGTKRHAGHDPAFTIQYLIGMTDSREQAMRSAENCYRLKLKYSQPPTEVSQ